MIPRKELLLDSVEVEGRTSNVPNIRVHAVGDSNSLTNIAAGSSNDPEDEEEDSSRKSSVSKNDAGMSDPFLNDDNVNDFLISSEHRGVAQTRGNGTNTALIKPSKLKTNLFLATPASLHTSHGSPLKKPRLEKPKEWFESMEKSLNEVLTSSVKQIKESKAEVLTYISGLERETKELKEKFD